MKGQRLTHIYIPSGHEVEILRDDGGQSIYVRFKGGRAQFVARGSVIQRELVKRHVVAVPDDITALLKDCSLDELYVIAADKLDESVTYVRARYGKYNPGMQRMLIGQKIRNYVKKQQGVKS